MWRGFHQFPRRNAGRRGKQAASTGDTLPKHPAKMGDTTKI